ncbi:hypothetical protein L7F22_021200 [Adiantum nelumboides]|nr:hypothetical protein [Adiantum nelumboides]
MVEQGLQVRFNGDGLYVEEYKKNGKLVAQGKKVEGMFTPNVNMPEMNAAMFAQGTGVVVDVEIWHKWIGHANVQRLKLMQSKELVTGFPQFRVSEMQQSTKTSTLQRFARALMSEKNMPPCYRVEATSTAVYIMNMTPTGAVHDVTPEETFIGKKPDVSHFKVFKCIAYMHVPYELRTKLDPKAETCVFIGYFVEQKGYKCFNPVTRQVRVSKDVFDEMATWYADVKDDIGADVNKSVAKNSDVQSQVFSGSQWSPTSNHVVNPWSGRLHEEVSHASSINVSRKGK